MNDKTIGKLVTDNIKLVAFQRDIYIENKKVKTIYRLTDFGWSEPIDRDFPDEPSLVDAFMKSVAGQVA